MEDTKAKNIDEYIATFPAGVQELLEKVRDTIRQAAPDAQETISYAIPTFTLNRSNLVHFAGYKNHIGFYPARTGSEAFKEELSGFKTGKGSVQFPIDQPIPLDLIRKIVKFRVQETYEKAAAKTITRRS